MGTYRIDGEEVAKSSLPLMLVRQVPAMPASPQVPTG